VAVLTICVVINSTLPIWLGIANCRDYKKQSANAAVVLEENDSESEPEGISKSSPPSVISDGASSLISSQLSAILEARPGKKGRVHHKKRRRRERDIRSAVRLPKFKVTETTIDELEILPGSPSFNPSKSVMSSFNVDDFSMNDGVNETAGTKFEAHERRSCCQTLLEVSEWDSSLASLAGFYMIQGITGGINEIIQVAIIGHAIGLTEANAFIMVSFLMKLTFTVVYGFQEAIGVLVPQADGAGNDLMVGRYLQIGIVFTILFLIPGLLVWSFFMYDTIIWFGFDEATAIIAQNYTYSILLAKMAENVDGCLTEFLDVIDRELYITIYSVVSEIVSTGMLVAIAYSGMSSMVLIGVAETAVSVTLLVTNLVIIINKGWLDDYEEGLFKTCGLKDWRAMRTTFVTAAPLAIAWILTMGEWQVMLIFAQSIGPAEVAVWNLLGYIWDLFETITEAIAEAAEVRVGFRMGAGRPQDARKMSERGIYFGTQIAIITAGGLFVSAEYMLPLLTPNLVYQKVLFDQIPLIGFSGILMVPGLIIEGILCAQGRVRLMTTIEIVASWFVAIPSAAVLTYYFKLSLDGIVSALVVGYSVAVTLLLFFYLRSDWEKLSERVIEQNAANGAQHVDTEWDELPEEVQKAASTLGYTKITWESNIEPSSTKKSWNDLTEVERSAAGVLGFNKKKWNGEVESYEECDFDDLPEEVKKAAKFLGFTRATWDNDGKIPIESKDWDELTPAQQKAATTIGFTQEKWDNDSDSDSSSSSSSEPPKRASAKKKTAKKPAQVASWSSKSTESDSAPVRRRQTHVGMDGSDHQSYGCSLTKYGRYPFDKLPRGIQKAATDLGFTRSTWDRNLFVPRQTKTWNKLSPSEKDAARALGCTEKQWKKLLDSSW